MVENTAKYVNLLNIKSENRENFINDILEDMNEAGWELQGSAPVNGSFGEPGSMHSPTVGLWLFFRKDEKS